MYWSINLDLNEEEQKPKQNINLHDIDLHCLYAPKGRIITIKKKLLDLIRYFKRELWPHSFMGILLERNRDF